MRKVFLFFVFVGIALGLFFGVGSALLNNKDIDDDIVIDSGGNYVHELNIPIMEIDSLNPILTYNEQVRNLMWLMYEPLVKIGKNDELVGMLATEWAEKNDTNWIIKLRKGAKWHNGNSFTSEDVIFTIRQIISEDINSPYKSNLKNVVSVEKIDEYSVSVTLLEKDDFFIYKLIFPIIPEYYFKNGEILNATKNNMPIGTGAFKYDSTNDNIIKLVMDKNWWNAGDNMRLNTIYLHKYDTYGEAIKAYKSADVDLIVTTMSNWEKKFGTIGNNIYRFESSIFDTIIPNTKRTSLSDSSVRKAILFAINRENIVSKVFNSNATIADMPIHTRSNNYLSDAQSVYDLDKARQVLINAGWKLSNGVWSKDISGTSYKLKFTLIVNKENDEQVSTATIIKEGLADLSIPITIKELDWGNYKKSLSDGSFDLAISSFDIKNELSILDILDANSENNYARYSNEKMSEAINKIKNNYNPDSMKELENLYKDEVPYIGLYFRNNTILTNKSVKGSIEPTWYNPYENIVSWCK